MIRFLTITLFALGMSLGLLTELAAAPVRSGAVEVELISEADSIAAGESIHVAIRLKTASHWHVYWKNPGDSGTPVKAKWELPETVTAGPLLFPAPEEYETAGFVTFGHEGEVILLTKLNIAPGTEVGTTLPVKATVSWLACDPSRCVPGRAELSLNIKITRGDPKPNRWSKQIKAARQALPKPTKGTATIAGDKVHIKIPAVSATTSKGQFFPSQPSLFQLSDPKPEVTEDEKGVLTIILQKEPDSKLPDTIAGVLTFADGVPLRVEANR